MLLVLKNLREIPGINLFVRSLDEIAVANAVIECHIGDAVLF